MRILLTTIFAISLAAMLQAQQDPQFTQYMYNTMGFNPGYAGSQDMISINAANRNQWMGMPKESGAPITQLIHMNAPFKLFEKEHGAGLVIYNDKFGFNSNLYLKGNYAYRLALGEGKLGIGVGFGLINSELKGTFKPAISPIQPGKTTEFNMDFGLFYRTEKVYMGFSVTNLFEPTLKYTDNVDAAFLVRNYFVTSGYTLQLPNPDFQLVPSFLILSDINSTKLDLNSTVIYKNRFWGGLTYRVGSDVCAIFGLEFMTGVKFTTSWDLPTSSVISYSKGSLEVSVSYSFKLSRERLPQRYKSIRFL